MIKIIINKNKITSESLKENIYSLLKINDKHFNKLYLDEDGDITHEAYEYDSDSSGATYKSQDEYTGKGWLRFIKLDDNCIYFGLMTRKDGYLTKEIYSWYHNVFSDFLLNNFDDEISEIIISSKLVETIDIFPKK